MSLAFTFLYVTNQAKDLTLKGTWDFQTKLVERKGIRSRWLDKAIKKRLYYKIKDKDQALTSRADGDKSKQVRDNISLSRSSFSKSERLWQKSKF